MAGLLYRLGRFSARRHWTVIVSWVLIIALTGVGYALFAGVPSPSISIPGTATAKVQDELAAKFPRVSGGSGSLVLETTSGRSFTDTQKADVQKMLADIADMTGVKRANDPFTTQADLDSKRQQVIDGRTKIAAGKEQIASAQAQLSAGQAQLDQGQQQLDGAKAAATPPLKGNLMRSRRGSPPSRRPSPPTRRPLMPTRGRSTSRAPSSSSVPSFSTSRRTSDSSRRMPAAPSQPSSSPNRRTWCHPR